jgi:hypothetical protein
MSIVSLEQAFQHIHKRIGPVLLQQGFSQKAESIYSKPSKNLHITYQNENELIRLVCDEKEQFFVIEYLPTELSEIDTGWTDILLQFFRSHERTITVIEEIAADMEIHLNNHLASKI